MNSYLLQIKPIKEINLDFFHQEISAIIETFKTDKEDTKLLRVPATNCILLTSNNIKLRFALSKNQNYIATPY